MTVPLAVTSPAPAELPSDALPALGAHPSPRDFLTGFALPWKSLGLIRRHRSLRRMSLAMAAVTAILLLGLAVLLVLYTDDLVARLVPPPESAWVLPLWWLGVAAVGMLAYVVGALTLPPLALSPLQDPLGEATEALFGGKAAPSGWRALGVGIWIGLKHTVVRLGWMFAGLLLLLPLNLIPVLGSLAFSLLAALWGMIGLTAEHVGAPLARHRHASREAFRVVRARPALCLGFGAAVQLVLLIPVINAFFLPLAVVGGTLLFLGLERAGALPAPAAT